MCDEIREIVDYIIKNTAICEIIMPIAFMLFIKYMIKYRIIVLYYSEVKLCDVQLYATLQPHQQSPRETQTQLGTRYNLLLATGRRRFSRQTICI